MSFSALVHASLRLRATVCAVALLLLAAGAWQAMRTQVDVLPDLTRPSVSIHLEAPHFSAEDAAAQLAWPLESALAGLPGLVRLRSSSVAGLALVQVEFDWGSDPYRNRQLVTERIDAVRSQLPSGIEPRLGPLTSLMGEILLVALRDPADVGLRELRRQADWVLRPGLLAVPGVSQVTVIGGEVAQWEVQLDPARMKLFNIRTDQLITALRGTGENRGGGLESVGGRDVSLRGIATPFDPAALGLVAVDQREAGPVWLSQVASVVPGTPLRRGAAGADGEPAVILAIQKQPGADTLALTDAVEAQLARFDATLPKGTQRSIAFRQADFIRASVGHVRDALWHGALIVALVLALFISGGRATLISLVAIPLSVAGAILALSLLGLSINTLTLGGLAIAVGELVDDAVVGVENVARRLRESGTASLEVIAQATLEVRGGILLATLLIVAGFTPLLFLGGVEGRLFASLGAAYALAILASLLVAATVTPALCAMGFLGQDTRAPKERAWLIALRERYVRVLDRALGHRAALLAVVSAVALVALGLLATLPRAFLPTLNESTLTINLVLSPGLTLEESDRAGRAAEQLVLELPEATSVARRTGRAELDEHAEGPHYSELDVQLAESTRDRDAVLADLSARLADLPGQVSISQPISHRLDHLLSGVRAPVAVKIFGEDAAQLDALAARVRSVLTDVPGLREAGLDVVGRAREQRLRVDAGAAALYGLSPARVIEAATGLSAGIPLSRILEAPYRTDLVLRLPDADRDPSRIADLLIDAPSGPVPLKWVASLETVEVPDRVLRENGRRRLLVSAFATGNLDHAVGELEQRLQALPVPPGFEIRVEGQVAQARAATHRLFALAFIAFGLMLTLLYAHFRSLQAAVIVLASVPLAWIGGAIALRVTGTPLSIASLIGFVTLAGIAARNSILKIGRYADLAQQQPDLPLHARVLRGSAERLAPVLMTSLVAALSLLPLLIGADDPGKELLHPVALVVFGGLFSSTLLDSFVTPAMVLLWRRRSGVTLGH